jgi:ABC-2 type transport system ATP-binding protein
MAELALRVRGLHKQYPNVLAVDGLDLDVPRGEVFGLLGPNGAGKTTTLEIIEGLTQPDGGVIEILGLDWRHHGKEIRSRIGVQLQSTSLFNKITPREALDLYGSYYPRRRPTQELLDLVQLNEKADAYHITLSGGQQQRLAIALALVNDPELVFLDEPTTGLDPQARRSLWEVVRHMKGEGRTVILTTHYMEEAEALCDRLAIMDHGRILTSGTPLELISQLDLPSIVEFAFDGEAPDAASFAHKLGQPVERRGDMWEIPTRIPRASCPASWNSPRWSRSPTCRSTCAARHSRTSSCTARAGASGNETMNPDDTKGGKKGAKAGYRDLQIDSGSRLDLLVENHLIVELKAVKALLPAHHAQILSSLKITGHRLGLLINFNVPLIKQGIHRVIL